MTASRIAELEAALRPFAERAESIPTTAPNGMMVHFRAHHCRAARAALATSPPPAALGVDEVALEKVRDQFRSRIGLGEHVIDEILTAYAALLPQPSPEVAAGVAVRETCAKLVEIQKPAPVSMVDKFVCAALDSAAAAIRDDGERPYGEVMDELDHAHRLAQEEPGGCITSAELIRRCGGDPEAPFERGPFPPEMRQFPAPEVAAAPSVSGVREMLASFGQDEFREGARADYVTASDWEDYLEVPLSVLEKIRASLASEATPVAGEAKGEPEDSCTDCGGSRITHQTERRCACAPPAPTDALKVAVEALDRLSEATPFNTNSHNTAQAFSWVKAVSTSALAAIRAKETT